MIEVMSVATATGFSESLLMNAPWSGERLRDIRSQAQLNQYDVAALMTEVRGKDRNVGQAMVSQWESGKRTPDADDIYDICVALHCNCTDLYNPVGRPVRWQGGRPRKPSAD